MPPISILIADDDVTIRQCLRRMVEADPRFQVCWEADNGLEALALAQQHRPQVILLDAQMPRMDGIEATRCLRQHDYKTPILVLSVYDQARAQALAAGATEVIAKDCSCDAIRAAIHRLTASCNGGTENCNGPQ
ncbi:MAG TPA: response regulator [Chthonomonadaceae bacterium]|nr:response regulator [Chthonomonadaceae bacterium]